MCHLRRARAVSINGTIPTFRWNKKKQEIRQNCTHFDAFLTACFQQIKVKCNLDCGVQLSTVNNTVQKLYIKFVPWSSVSRNLKYVKSFPCFSTFMPPSKSNRASTGGNLKHISICVHKLTYLTTMFIGVFHVWLCVPGEGVRRSERYLKARYMINKHPRQKISSSVGPLSNVHVFLIALSILSIQLLVSSATQILFRFYLLNDNVAGSQVSNRMFVSERTQTRNVCFHASRQWLLKTSHWGHRP